MYFIVTILLSAVAYYFSTGIYNSWLLTWVAPMPLLIYALRASAGAAFLASFIACFLGFSSGILAYANTIIPISVFIYGDIINATAYSVLVMLFRYIALRKKHWVWSFLFASGWTAYEFITSLHSPAGTVDSLAYTQIFNLPVIQIASITGIWGISFLLMLIPASIALTCHYRNDSKLWLKTLVIPIGMILLTLAFGLYRLHVPNQGATVKVGMASIGMTMQEMLSRGQPQEVEKIINRYIHCIDLLSRAGSEVILLPEKIVALNLNEQANLLKLLADTARNYRIALIAGLSVQDGDKLYNSAYLFLPNGETALRYDKEHLLPSSEGRYMPGENLGVKDMEPKGYGDLRFAKIWILKSLAEDIVRQELIYCLFLLSTLRQMHCYMGELLSCVVLRKIMQ